MGQVEKCKKIMEIVAVLVLVTVMANGLEIKYYRRAPLAVAGKQYWHNERNVQALQDNIPLNLEMQSSAQIENVRDRQNFDQQGPSMALIGQTGLTNEDHSFKLESMLAHLKCPSLKISLDLLSSHNCERSSMQRCIADKCRRQIEKLSIQQPFYVDEPRWVEIEVDYGDKLTHNFNTEDPFFVTRGKKILRSIEARNNDRSNTDDDDRDNLFDNVKRSTGSSDVNQEDDRDKRNGSKRKEERKKELQLNNQQLEDLVRHLDPFNDAFFLSRGKKHFPRDTIQEISFDDLETETVERKSDEKTKRSIQIESEGSENASTNASLIGNDNMTLSESNVTRRVSSRSKRNSCADFSCIIDDSEKTLSWMDDSKKMIFDSTNIQPRNKHSDISDIINEPFFISRGKKNSKNINYESRSMPTDYHDSLNSLGAATRVLWRLFDSRRCNSKVCKDLDKFVSQTYEPMRDRRSSLDDLLRKYDPFYVARGKRMRSGNSEEDQQRSKVSQRGEIYSKDRVSYDFRSFGKR